jgi:Salmonella virulence plasmid 65kDa B protein
MGELASVDASLEVADRNVADLVVRADVALDARTGAASVSVPLPLTPGRGGLDPELALTYGAGGGNSPFGVGWSLGGVPAITLDPRDGVPRYDGEDGVAFAGERLIPWLERDGPRWVPRTSTVGEFAVRFYRRAVEQDPRLRFERWIDRLTTAGRSSAPPPGWAGGGGYGSATSAAPSGSTRWRCWPAR